MRLVARQKIEVVPFDKTEFDFISFIDFSKATKSSYCSTELKRNKKIKHIYANLFPRKQSINNVQNKYAFQIILGDEIESVHVYVKYNICIYLKYESNHPCNIFVNQNKVNDDSLLYQTTKYFNNGKHPCHECIKNYFLQYKGRLQKNQFLINQKCDTKTILSCCPGYVTIYHTNNSLETGEETSETFIQILTNARDNILELGAYLKNKEVNITINEVIIKIINSKFMHFKVFPGTLQIAQNYYQLTETIDINLLYNLFIKIHESFDFKNYKHVMNFIR